jgi:hypothetical protein
MDPLTVNRRRFLQLSVFGVLASAGESACSPSTDRDTAAVDRPQLLAMLGPDRVRQLGTHYRATTPTENSADALRAAISAGEGIHLPFSGDRSLEHQVRDDFAQGRTVLVDGWVLSVTEARQAALFSLSPA